MLTKRVIPCLDIEGGRVVKGVRFRELRDAGDPVELAARYDAEGADEVVFLDIGATSEGRSTMLEVARRTAESVFIPLTVGGGVRSVADIRRLLLAGADKVAINSCAFRDPSLIGEAAAEFGSQAIVIAIDARRTEPGAWEVYLEGGRSPTGASAIEWAVRAAGLGAGELLITSMDADGTTGGYELELTRAVSAAVTVPVVAFGGAGRPQHVADALDPTMGGADAALAASVFHFGVFSVMDAKRAVAERGLPVRIPHP